MNDRAPECASKSSSSLKPAESNAKNIGKVKSNYNHLFSNERNREIQLDNEIIAKKIEAVKSTYPAESLSTTSVRVSSAACNRARKTKEIQKENEAITSRIKNVKSTINK